MSTKTDASTSSDKFDLIKWLLVFVFLGSGIVGFYYFAEQSFLLRVAALLVIAFIAAFIASKTEKGRTALDFVREAHLEVRKVVWPTRQETVQMTGIVILMVVLMALFIWLLDSLLMWLVRLLTGQGG